MKSIFASTLLGLCLITHPASAKTVTDSLVANLNCDNLNVSSIYANILPAAFSSANHLPVKNWAFSSGGIGLGACWGMSSTQRKLFYLLRLNESHAADFDLTRALDTVRGTTVGALMMQENSADPNSRDPQRLNENKLKEYGVIPLREPNITSEWSRNTGLGFLERMLKGQTYQIGSRQVYRALRTEVERSQELHFFRARNIGMGAGSGPRPPKENADTLKILMANMSSKRLSLINLRLNTTTQHIVIPKTFTKDGKGNVWITAYDSNQPENDQLIYYAASNGHFYSPQIMGGFIGDPAGMDYTHPLGVYVVDEEERGYIDQTLLKYYKGLCQK